MSRPRRVSVTAPDGPASAPARPAEATDPAVLELARRIRRAQLRRATVTVALGGLLLFGLPVLLLLAPDLAGLRLLGVPGGWLAVAIAPYPLLAGLAWWQLSGAERDERAPDGTDGDGTDRDGTGRRDDEVGRLR
ncbi:hypothetical protein [Pseudonocardia sp. KRD291]|uniref:hypothetical protein n=1 Tax=Pseudonocardia sp. KRD291 TaxID=2792007 RepID=UPI001C4A31E0|nr:hypothetical protein [Pseudonocardia sp. KRD291]MBW0105105.1 hypothetical protein [Pseudonocardia sp. KRD291]